jgi:hypothetical protein
MYVCYTCIIIHLWKCNIQKHSNYSQNHKFWKFLRGCAFQNNIWKNSGKGNAIRASGCIAYMAVIVSMIATEPGSSPLVWGLWHAFAWYTKRGLSVRRTTAIVPSDVCAQDVRTANVCIDRRRWSLATEWAVNLISPRGGDLSASYCSVVGWPETFRGPLAIKSAGVEQNICTSVASTSYALGTCT